MNFAWNWNSGSPKAEENQYFNVTPNITKLMKARPQARVLFIGGYYDLATPALAPQYALIHAGVPLDRTKMRVFDSGHTPYEGDDSRKQVSVELHDFISQGRAADSGVTLDRNCTAASPPASGRNRLRSAPDKRLSASNLRRYLGDQ